MLKIDNLHVRINGRDILKGLSLDVQPGQRVITTPLTFAASANCVRYCGGEVHFADIDPDTALIDLAAVRRLLDGPSTPADLPGLEADSALVLARRLLRDGVVLPA